VAGCSPNFGLVSTADASELWLAAARNVSVAATAGAPARAGSSPRSPSKAEYVVTAGSDRYRSSGAALARAGLGFIVGQVKRHGPDMGSLTDHGEWARGNRKWRPELIPRLEAVPGGKQTTAVATGQRQERSDREQLLPNLLPNSIAIDGTSGNEERFRDREAWGYPPLLGTAWDRPIRPQSN
jgi:hypothetical protein